MTLGKLDFMVKEIMRKFPECTYKLNQSSKSSSLYLYITDGYLVRSLRVADHFNGYNCEFHLEIVSDKINKKWLYGAIVNLCKSMRRSRTKYCFKVMEKQLDKIAN